MEISYDGHSVVTVTHHCLDSEFDVALEEANHILRRFKQSQPGSQWGCDGVGYDIQKKVGLVCVHKSGVGPRKFKEANLEYSK